MEENVVNFNGYTKHKINASKMLKELAKQEPDNVFVICYDEEWDEVTFHSNNPKTADNHYMASLFIHKLLNGDFYED